MGEANKVSTVKGSEWINLWGRIQEMVDKSLYNGVQPWAMKTLEEGGMTCGTRLKAWLRTLCRARCKWVWMME